MTPEERSLRARIAAYRLHARHDSKELTRPAREKFMGRFEREVDPNNELPAAERARRAGQAKKAYFCELALKSARARKARAGT